MTIRLASVNVGADMAGNIEVAGRRPGPPSANVAFPFVIRQALTDGRPTTAVATSGWPCPGPPPA